MSAGGGDPHGARGPAVAELCARAKKGMALGLDRLRAVLATLGDPHVGLPAVHVAGSNGKGSVCAMVESIARHAGLRTGLYTSPHLCRIAERIRVDGEPVDDATLEAALARVLSAGPDLTFFELLTAAAFLVFREAKVDVAVIEVGLGGRLDATNVLDAPLATAVTSIALEHTALLGDTLGAIGREKAGIVKRGAPLVLGLLDAEADAAIASEAAARDAGPITRVGRDVHVTWRADGEVSIARAAGRGADAITTRLGLRGPHQAENAATACALAFAIAPRFPGLERAIARGLEAATWPGRLERLDHGGVRVVLDCAHNAHGARALVAALGSGPDALDPARTTLVFGALADKAWAEMLALVAPLAERRIYAPPKGRVAAAPEELAALAPGERADDGPEAVERALAASRAGDTVLVTGSIYLVGEVRGALLGVACDPVIAL